MWYFSEPVGAMKITSNEQNISSHYLLNHRRKDVLWLLGLKSSYGLVWTSYWSRNTRKNKTTQKKPFICSWWLKEYKAMLTNCSLHTPTNNRGWTQWNSHNSDDSKNVRFTTQQRDIATKHEVQKYDLKTSLIYNFR